MQVPKIEGLIKRRLLVNYQLDPEIAQTLLPKPFSPKEVKSKAIIGVCLIRLEDIRPTFFARLPVGISSENAAHRIAVEWEENGVRREGVYIFRRDTNSMINILTGGRLFPGEHTYSKFDIDERDGNIKFSMTSKDKEVDLYLSGKESGNLPANSVFSSIDELSDLFKKGADGFSPVKNQNCLQGLCLQTKNWNMTPFQVDELTNTYLHNTLNIPDEKIEFDSVVIMRNIRHSWKQIPSVRNNSI